MLEAWWLAHKLEFVIGGSVIGMFIVGSVIVALIQWIKTLKK